MEKLLLIDGNSIAFRAFYALPLLSNKQGLHTNAVFGFTTMLLRMLEEHRPTHLLIAFDAGKQTFRHQQYADYKGGRSKTPPELSEQFPLLKEMIDAFGIRRLESMQYEADDIIGSFSKLAEEHGIESVVVSGDKDLLQIVSGRVTMALTRKGISEVDLYDLARLQEVYGLTPNQIPDLKGLMGDASDNIPGVPGVGEKTALKLLHDFATVEGVLSAIDQLKGKLKEKIEQHAEDARISKQLATIERAMPLELTLDDLRFDGFHQETTVEMFKRLEFKSLIDKVTQIDSASVDVSGELVPLSWTLVDSADHWQLLLDALPSIEAMHVETVGEHPHHAECLGVSFAASNQLFFVPYDAMNGNEHLEFAQLLHAWLRDCAKPKVLFDLNRTAVVLGWLGIRLEGVVFDISLAAYLLNPSESRQSLDELSLQYRTDKLRTDEEVYGKGVKFSVPAMEHLAEHAVRKAHAIAQLRRPLEDALAETDMTRLMNDMELPLASLLAELELRGVALDAEQLRTYGQHLTVQIEQLVQRIYEQAEMEFNINSTKQLADVLFEKMALPPGKKTKSGYSTDAEELERLAFHSQIVRDILHYRQLTKLNSTYVEGLLKEVHPKTAKVHTYFNQTTTATGRLSSQYPNLQNIPIRLEEGRLIRKAFVPSEAGWSILAADYSQIELRVLAHISADERLIEAFQNNMDIHTKTAMDVFGVTAEQVDANMRRQAKAVNFGIVYGISDYGLSQNLGITRKEAARFIEQYFAVFAGVKRYMEEIVKQAKQDGYVTTLLHRRRYLPDIRSSNFNTRSFAERTAMNTPIQGTAADIIKLAMIQLAQRMAQQGLRSRMLLQVHDELVFEVPADEIEVMSVLVPQVMEHAVALSVPLKADLNVGANWYEAK